MDRTIPEQRTIYLWTDPRSLSTAFLRAMMHADGCLGIHEPYCNIWEAEIGNFGCVFDGRYDFSESMTYEEMKVKLQSGFSGYDLVFIKEVPKMLGTKVNDHTYIPEHCLHTFLIRHPIRRMKSYIAAFKRALADIPEGAERDQTSAKLLSVDHLREQFSARYLQTIYDTVTVEYGQKLIIVDADDLQRDPEATLRTYCKEIGVEYRESMVSWGALTPEHAQVFSTIKGPNIHFFQQMLNSTELKQQNPREPDIEDIDEKYRDIVEEAMPLYLKLRQLKLKPINHNKC